jgi:hypothetical protein
VAESVTVVAQVPNLAGLPYGVPVTVERDRKIDRLLDRTWLRTADPAPAPEPEPDPEPSPFDDVPEAADDIRTWVDNTPTKARVALAAEQARPESRRRAGLIADLEALLL